MTDLSEVLIQAFRRRPAISDIRFRRQRLCEFIRAHEARVFDVCHPRASEVRELLGWDDETMAAFVTSPLLCHSSPHAAMNSFPPTLAYAWILGRAVHLAENLHGYPAVHVRTQCTHNNFYDTFTKPHAWWHRTPEGTVVKTQLFSRRSIKDHPILSKPAPALDAGSLHAVDRAAVELARLATNYAYFCVIYGLYLERALDFHVPHRLLELPIDLLNRFTIAESGLMPWFDAVTAAGQNLRIERDNAPMSILTRPEARVLADSADRWLKPAVVGSNQVNIAQCYLLGISLMIGGPKMARYIPEINPWIAAFTDGNPAWACEQPELVPVTQVPMVELLGCEREAAYTMREWGISTSLSLIASAELMASAEAGGAAAMLTPMLTTDYARLHQHDVAWAD